ncbi:hypothetical protein M5X00_24235 [Paenibacillus alvei]|uniref:Uncharacterized protein n=1 Tax=Paenibacillus alvei TaxID=44250 RepID=A0ABT4GR24_PAEAL|nr:hypothetical protein [Paenibacillus alvei]MCY9543629.1 hypothetical protein [Paenibacillus alvei]MCY9736116.1 hypothetical protein [Paenibacillus alvei]MCY9757339.1 hypothetical protein [Paenibacillus alvei]MCY9759130.1 hypothetical protein [Paenibacillus alvei]MCY9770411.1 hypothetical protein [Paenibacillus alvei]
MIYRYYRKPTTFRAVNCVRRLIENGRLKPSEIVSIRGSFSIQRWYRLTIRTNTEQLQFTGFSWFYHGSGPLGLQQVLRWLLIPEEVVLKVTDSEFHGDNHRPNSFYLL